MSDSFFNTATQVGMYMHQALAGIGEAITILDEEPKANETARQHARRHLWLAQRQFEQYTDGQFVDAAVHLSGRLIEARLSMNPGMSRSEIVDLTVAVGAEIGDVVADCAAAA